MAHHESHNNKIPDERLIFQCLGGGGGWYHLCEQDAAVQGMPCRSRGQGTPYFKHSMQLPRTYAPWSLSLAKERVPGRGYHLLTVASAPQKGGGSQCLLYPLVHNAYYVALLPQLFQVLLKCLLLTVFIPIPSSCCFCFCCFCCCWGCKPTHQLSCELILPIQTSKSDSSCIQHFTNQSPPHLLLKWLLLTMPIPIPSPCCRCCTDLPNHPPSRRLKEMQPLRSKSDPPTDPQLTFS